MLYITGRNWGQGVMALLTACLFGLPALAQEAPPSEGEAGPDVEQPSDETQDPADREQALEARLAELEKKYEDLSAQMEAEAMERLVQDAKNEARAAQDEVEPEQREFLVGGLALQKLNPEISFSADFLLGLIINDTKFYAGESDRSGMPVREVSLHFQHVLDPYSMFKAALCFAPYSGVDLEEVYVSWFGVIPTVSFTVGRFRQNFGVLNRWHEHDLDQTEHPLALRLVLGEEGLVGNGIGVKWLMPALWAHVNEISLEVVDGENETLFAGEYFSIPSTMLHLKNYYDLNPDTYLELGLTGMFGLNNRRGLLNEEDELEDEPWRKTYVAGADLTVYWSPLQQAKYQSFTWRTEFYYANKEMPSGVEDDIRQSLGFYSYLQYQMAEQWFAGVRGDLALPTERDSDEYAWDAVPYVTYWQSEFVYFRLEYRYGDNLPYETPGEIIGRRTDHRVLLQIDFAAGPHKHEKY